MQGAYPKSGGRKGSTRLGYSLVCIYYTGVELIKNTLAYYFAELITSVRSFIVQDSDMPGAGTTKPLTSVIEEL
jgi:hypothetical protein